MVRQGACKVNALWCTKGRAAVDNPVFFERAAVACSVAGGGSGSSLGCDPTGRFPMCTCGHPEKYHTLQVCAVLGCRCISYESRWEIRRTALPLRPARASRRRIKRKP